MASEAEDLSKLQNVLSDVEVRVESIREKTIFIQNEKQKLLEILQSVQDCTRNLELNEDDIEDLAFNTERLILRCLTVDASVDIPRNESQDAAFNTVNSLLEELTLNCRDEPEQNFEKVESYLNACLAEPISAKVDTQFQSKLLGCTADDQKQFRKTLQSLHLNVQKRTSTLTSDNDQCNGSS